jgi:hypothetical protein
VGTGIGSDGRMPLGVGEGVGLGLPGWSVGVGVMPAGPLGVGELPGAGFVVVVGVADDVDRPPAARPCLARCLVAVAVADGVAPVTDPDA